ncbi:hypothetical protein DCAR_0209283 [Daucus carota subsp. sativus]|uniref:TFIIS N-terminal domain-containing protein n=1 Tax=Daucus carota subsp. sativus TaxID=79200 RepID=A0AAF0WI85_DAUCS|nr:hypothetical protein DCAR_0209283 [Daucus carota subsp. sativus]
MISTVLFVFSCFCVCFRYDDENDEPVMCSDDGGGGRRRRSPTPVLLESNHRERLVKSAGDADVKEMWRTVAGGDSEQEDIAEFTNPFNRGRKKKKREKSAAEIALLVEQVLAELEFAAEEDVLLNIESKPAVNKLMKLPFLTDVLSKKQLQHEFLDHGILTVLKSWLEPLPDGSLPSINIRAAILKILTNFPIDLDQYERKEQLKKSGLGKVIMFLSRSDEETASNRKVAKELVDSWSRSIFNKSTRFEDMRKFDDERILLQGASGKRESKCGKWSSRQRTFRPEAMPLDFVVRPPSKIDPDLVRARAEHVVQDQCHLKKLEQLKAPKRKQLQATKISVEGRTMVKYL